MSKSRLGEKHKTKLKITELPQALHKRLGQLDPVKKISGSEGGLGKIVSFDAISNCLSSCRARNHCPYWDDNSAGRGLNTGKCQIQYRFVRSVMSILLSNYEVDEVVGVRIGLHLIPLYLDYAKICIESVSQSSAILTDNKGRKYPNPLLKEKRDMSKQIESAWKSIGIEKLVKKSDVPGTPGKKVHTNFAQDLEDGGGWE
jgi:hypothetical protein